MSSCGILAFHVKHLLQDVSVLMFKPERSAFMTDISTIAGLHEKNAGMQFVREFAKLGLTRSVGGVLGLALSRELTPVITSIILAGQASPSQIIMICHKTIMKQTMRLGLLWKMPREKHALPVLFGACF